MEFEFAELQCVDVWECVGGWVGVFVPLHTHLHQAI